MSVKPITFSGPMVRALLAGTKWQTRRLLKSETAICREPGWEARKGEDGIWRIVADTPELSGSITAGARFSVGDRLYVREHWRTFVSLDGVKPIDLLNGGRGAGLRYEADTSGMSLTADGNRTYGPRESAAPFGKFRQAMHLPRWGSRITLTVTDVRVGRLKDISREDALAEGIVQHGRFFALEDADWDDAYLDPREAYFALLDSLHGHGFSDKNPWLAAYSFSFALGNVDGLPHADGYAYTPLGREAR